MSVCYVELKIDDLVCKSLQKKGGACGIGESSFQLPSCFYQCKMFAECCPLSLLPREERHIMAARGGGRPLSVLVDVFSGFDGTMACCSQSSGFRSDGGWSKGRLSQPLLLWKG